MGIEINREEFTAEEREHFRSRLESCADMQQLLPMSVHPAEFRDPAHAAAIRTALSTVAVQLGWLTMPASWLPSSSTGM